LSVDEMNLNKRYFSVSTTNLCTLFRWSLTWKFPSSQVGQCSFQRLQPRVKPFCKVFIV